MMGTVSFIGSVIGGLCGGKPSGAAGFYPAAAALLVYWWLLDPFGSDYAFSPAVFFGLLFGMYFGACVWSVREPQDTASKPD